jgi:hypothetical protein
MEGRYAAAVVNANVADWPGPMPVLALVAEGGPARAEARDQAGGRLNGVAAIPAGTRNAKQRIGSSPVLVTVSA